MRFVRVRFFVNNLFDEVVMFCDVLRLNAFASVWRDKTTIIGIGCGRGVFSTPILTIQMQTRIETLSYRRKIGALKLVERLMIRNDFWMTYSPTVRRYFSLSRAVDKHCTNFDVEVDAVHMALTETAKREEQNIVIFIDSQATIRAISSVMPSKNSSALECQLLIVSMIKKMDAMLFYSGYQVIVVSQGNEFADSSAKARSNLLQPDPPGPVDYHEIALSQTNDYELTDLLKTENSLNLKNVKLLNSDVELYCDLSTYTARPYMPEKFRKICFDCIHNLAHPAIKTTSKLVRIHYVWPSINKDCIAWAKQCISFQRSKVHRHT
ncbi:pol polyprotein [Nephila pilipes]|uniref:Pol polyprotein n=1 Tax=Nephila pilipes TaxID=299642 RepID=A0A8X6TXA0_NEPPI|nr:pol polyprotein [Nephila pilipes]